jgi:hypothetical protein
LGSQDSVPTALKKIGYPLDQIRFCDANDRPSDQLGIGSLGCSHVDDMCGNIEPVPVLRNRMPKLAKAQLSDSHRIAAASSTPELGVTEKAK